MNKVVINIKADPEVKEAAQDLARSLGLTLSSLINTQLKQLVNQKRLILEAPYPVIKMTKKLENELDEVHQEVKKGQVSQTFDNLDDLFADLDKPLEDESSL